MIGCCGHSNGFLTSIITCDFSKIRRKDNLSHGINYSIKICHNVINSQFTVLFFKLSAPDSLMQF
jgi:hypothetical protein